MDLPRLRAAVLAEWPDIDPAEITHLGDGYDSVALEARGCVFKFPRHAEAKANLRREAAVLAAVRPVVTLAVPGMTLHEGPPMFSRHAIIPGDHLPGDHYETLAEAVRERLAADVARFLAELHAIPRDAMEAAGAGPVASWLSSEDILAGALPLLPPHLRPYARDTIAAWRDLPPDPHGEVFGFFDAHGWNMAFDHETRRLNGIYDFGDSGFGPLHREFVQPALISREFAARLADAYEARTGRRLDRRRIEILTGTLRLAELADCAGDVALAPAMVANVAAWAGRRPRRRPSAHRNAPT